MLIPKNNNYLLDNNRSYNNTIIIYNDLNTYVFMTDINKLKTRITGTYHNEMCVKEST